MSSNSLEDPCVFMTNPMRSGSALLSRILNANSQVSISYSALCFFRNFYGRYDPISNVSNVNRLITDAAFLLYNRFDIRIDDKECLSRVVASGATYGQVFRSLLKGILQNTDKPILGDLEALAWTRIPDFLRMCPGGKVIGCLRDPRDVVTSFKSMTIAPGNDYIIALFNVIDAVNHFYRFRDLNPSRVYIVGFERFKENPEDEVIKLCSFLDVDYSPSMLDSNSWKDHFGNVWDDSRSLTFRDEREWMAPVGRWKQRLSPEDLYLCEWIGKEQIARMGLGFSGQSASQVIFDDAIGKINSSPLLREAFKRWCDLNEGLERFPLDPLKPENWESADLKHPEAFDVNS